MKNNKGFTLVEIMVALAIMCIVIFTFTPLMLSSLKNVQMAGEQRKVIFDDKTDIEFKMATKEMDIDLENVAVYFTQQGIATPVVSSAEGNYVRANSQKLLGFIAKDTATMSVSPTTISELAPASTVINITCDFLEINDLAKFKLKMYDTATSKFVEVNKSAYGYSFANGGDEFKAVLNIPKNTFLRAGQPILISYGDGLSAQINITPPSLVAVGVGGAYYTRTPGTSGNWVAGRGRAANGTLTDGKLGANQLNDVAWTGDEYAVGGQNGSWYYVSEETPWAYKEIYGSGFFGTKVLNHIDDLFSPELLDNRIIVFAHEETLIWDTNLKSLSKATEMQGFSGSNGRAGMSITEAYFKSGASFKPYPVCTYAYSGNVYFSTNPNSLEAISSNNIPGISNVTCVASNKMGDSTSEIVVCSGGNQILRAYPGKGDITASSWSSIPTSTGSTVTGSSKYYYIIKSISSGVIGPFDEQLPVEAKGNDRNIVYNGVSYPIDSSGSASERDIMMEATVEKYTGASCGFLMTGNFMSANYGNDIMVAGGSDINILEDLNNNDIITVTGEKYYRYRGGNKFDQLEASNNSNTKIIKERFDGSIETVVSTLGPLVYLEKGKWFGCKVPSNVPTNARVNSIEYIGGKFYAVGNGGLILSSSDGKVWTNETNSSLSANLYGISGWGIE